MCGIVGYVGAGLGPALLPALLTSMHHRGPDGDGIHHDGALHMGMRRLSVIDLASGWQPLTSREGTVIVFQNGEIYNYRELRSELESAGWQFRTRSDTEVLAHGYAAWSIEGLLARIDGMYAIAIHDRTENRLHLARDRFGEKPLFYAAGRDCFGYSSTLLALAALPWVTDTIDPIALERYFALHFIAGDRTILQDVRQVLPGERLTLDLASFELVRHRYYRPRLRRPRRLIEDELAAALENAVCSRLIADVPVGVFLSGGLDSSLVAALAARQTRDIATFSIGFKDRGVDESAHALAVARQIGSRHHQFVFDQAEFATLLPEVAEALDVPIGDQALLPVYWLSREARRHVTVALSGEGADEVFAGYDYYRPASESAAGPVRRLSAALRRRPAARLMADAPLSSLSGYPLLTTRDERRRLLGAVATSPDSWERDLLRWLSQSSDRLQRASATDIATWLPDDLLVKFDRMSMAHGLEGRAPYLDSRVVDIGLNIAPQERQTRLQSKIALRRVAARYLPSPLLERPKQGFVLPMRRWIAEWFARHGGIAPYLADRSVPGVAMDALTPLLAADLESGLTRERLQFATLMICEWWPRFQRRRAALRRSG